MLQNESVNLNSTFMTFYNTYISEYLSTFTKKNNTMKKQLIDYIYTQLMRQDLSKLPCYLKGGTMEIFLFLALYSEIKGSEEARYMASIILADTHKKELNNQPYSTKRQVRSFLGNTVLS